MPFDKWGKKPHQESSSGPRSFHPNFVSLILRNSGNSRSRSLVEVNAYTFPEFHGPVQGIHWTGSLYLSAVFLLQTTGVASLFDMLRTGMESKRFTQPAFPVASRWGLQACVKEPMAPGLWALVPFLSVREAVCYLSELGPLLWLRREPCRFAWAGVPSVGQGAIDEMAGRLLRWRLLRVQAAGRASLPGVIKSASLTSPIGGSGWAIFPTSLSKKRAGIPTIGTVAKL